MLRHYSQDEIESRYQKLPEELQAAMYDFDVADKTFQIGKKHGLSTDKIGAMAEILGYVVLGFIGPREFVKALSEDIGMDMEKAKALASEINSALFTPLRGALKRAHDIEITEEDIQRGGEEMVRRAPPPFLDKLGTTAGAAPTRPKPETKPSPSSFDKAQDKESKPTFPGITPLPKTSPIDLRAQEPSRSAFISKPEDKKPEVPAPPERASPRQESERPTPSTTSQPSWIAQKPTPPQMPESGSTNQELGTKKELELVPPPPRPGPRIPPIDLRKPAQQESQAPPKPPMPSTPLEQKTTPQPYKGVDPYKESTE